MTIVSNDPTWWPSINEYHYSSYFSVAAFVVVAYDWALTFGLEVELVWRQHWSLMTVLYLGVRYLGILYAALLVPLGVSTISLTDAECLILYLVWNWTGVVVLSMLWVIIITRLHAMYQRSRKILIFLIVALLAVNIVNVVAAVIATMHSSEEELILSGTYQCAVSVAEHSLRLTSVAWILSIMWEVLTLCLAVWIAVKHLRELRQHSTGGIMEDCFTVLMKTHVVYFASFVAVSCFEIIIELSPTALTTNQFSLESQTFLGLLHIFEVAQMFVLGPRLILGVREFNAKLVTDSDAATHMTSIAFQERVHVSTDSSV